jgi:hypothetical protein
LRELFAELAREMFAELVRELRKVRLRDRLRRTIESHSKDILSRRPAGLRRSTIRRGR